MKYDMKNERSKVLRQCQKTCFSPSKLFILDSLCIFDSYLCCYSISSPLFLFPGDLASLFVDRADSRHCQNGALLVASLLTSENNDVHNPFHCHLHHFHTVPQHITPPYIHARRLREDGKPKKPFNIWWSTSNTIFVITANCCVPPVDCGLCCSLFLGVSLLFGWQHNSIPSSLDQNSDPHCRSKTLFSKL